MAFTDRFEASELARVRDLWAEKLEEAHEQEKFNIRAQFEAALRGLPPIAAQAYQGTGDMFVRYTRAYDNLKRHADNMVALGETVTIPARLKPADAIPTVTMGPK